MAASAPTIIDLKTTFLRSQILSLQRPLRPSPNFSTQNSEEENALRQKAIDDALHKLNGLLRKHNKVAYGPQAQRHVAEQIDRLYWGAGDRGVIGEVEEWAERHTDYRRGDVIEKLPEQWSEAAESKAPAEAARYKELQSRLVDLNEKRKAAREKVEQYRAAKKLLEPFEGEDAGLQDNLITKNGEVERELERMRMLMLRVERGIMGLEGVRGDDMDLDVDLGQDERRKLAALLGV